MTAKLRRTLWIGFLLCPPLLVILAFVAYPIISAFAYAFYDWQGLVRGGFVGLRNFRDVLAGENFGPATWNAVLHNLQVLITLLFVQNGVAFFLAWLLFKEPFGHRFHRVAVFLPVLLSTIIVGFLWRLFLNPNFGAVNAGLQAIGLGGLARPWLGDPSTALWTLILVNAWHWLGFPTLVFLAGMQRIPRDLLDAARLEKISEWQLLRRIVWPLVAPSATVAFTLLFIGAFNWFELPYVMAGLDGSPFGTTDVLGLLFYRTAFGTQSSGTQDFGHGSALAVLIFVFLTISTGLITWRLRRREIEL